ncbi:hypothetical protein NC651_021289 [Populus alba x Populus x berolinensis]|nr:hypothetical protein NC651_021289 [Populus alba x Populus x berolinensis]
MLHNPHRRLILQLHPFGIEMRCVKCLRCGNYGHQRGDRECPLKDDTIPESSKKRR